MVNLDVQCDKSESLDLKKAVGLLSTSVNVSTIGTVHYSGTDEKNLQLGWGQLEATSNVDISRFHQLTLTLHPKNIFSHYFGHLWSFRFFGGFGLGNLNGVVDLGPEVGSLHKRMYSLSGLTFGVRGELSYRFQVIKGFGLRKDLIEKHEEIPLSFGVDVGISIFSLTIIRARGGGYVVGFGIPVGIFVSVLSLATECRLVPLVDPPYIPHVDPPSTPSLSAIN